MVQVKLRNVDGPGVYDCPDMARRALPVVAAPDNQRRVGPGAYDSDDTGLFQYPRVKAKGLGADDYALGGKGDFDYAKGYSRKLRLDEQG